MINTASFSENMSLGVRKAKLYKGIAETEYVMVFEEILDFKQEDLSQDSVFVLDTGDELFVWIGERATDRDRKLTHNIHNHLLPIKDKYDSPWCVIMTKQGLEPEAFKKSFDQWDPELLAKQREEVQTEEEKYDALNFNEIDD